MNKDIFASKNVIRNDAGGLACSLGVLGEITQMVCTGTFNATFYASADKNTERLLDALFKLERTPYNIEYIAKLTIYARKYGFMKDTPAVLLGWLLTVDVTLFKKIFPIVIDNPKMLRNFFQVIRSGLVGRKSFGNAAKKAVNSWLNAASDMALLRASIGNSPSLRDIIALTHPKGKNVERRALFRYLLGYTLTMAEMSLLPPFIIELERFRVSNEGDPPNVPFELLVNCSLTTKHWEKIARNGGWQMLRMNLNKLQREGVFNNPVMVKYVANKLEDKELIKKSNVFPYQLYTTYKNINFDVPNEIKESIYRALIASSENIPRIDGKVWIFGDVSGSMYSPITGYRPGSTTQMTCVDVAALITASFLYANPRNTDIVLFDISLKTMSFKSSFFKEAEKIHQRVFNSFETCGGGGGTMCHLPLEYLNKNGYTGDLIIYISDNESWGIGSSSGNDFYAARLNATQKEWLTFKRNNPKAKLVCIDLVPNRTSQVASSGDVLNVGGFSDTVYNVIDNFYSGGGMSFVDQINTISLD